MGICTCRCKTCQSSIVAFLKVLYEFMYEVTVIIILAYLYVNHVLYWLFTS